METNYLTNKASAEWDCWTLDPAQAKKWERLGYEVTKDKQGGWNCSAPKTRIVIRRREKRQISENTRIALAAARERLKTSLNISQNSDQKSE